MKLIIRKNPFRYETENLLRVFFPFEKLTVSEAAEPEEDYCESYIDEKRITVTLCLDGEIFNKTADIPFEEMGDEEESTFTERKMAILLYGLLCEVTGYIPPWGILTGVRPAKLMSRLIAKMGDEGAMEYFTSELKVTEDKARLAYSVAKTEAPICDMTVKDSFSLYVSIPFCPSRCSYCSFVSHSNDSAKKLIPQYLDKLCDEIVETGKIAKNLGLRLESVYIGGGTPTTLSAEQLTRLTSAIKENFDLSSCREYTIEAGRPDSLTREKFEAIKVSDCTRISINPQTFTDSVLSEIGRNHTSRMTLDAYAMAREVGFDNINMDLIAGLPTDTLEGYIETLDKAIALDPENITVHTLALKRSATIVTDKRRLGDKDITGEMLRATAEKLTAAGYLPYYMYRQSRSLGNLENVGWAKKGYEGLYNVFMMEECHTILSVGAGAVIKLRNPVGSEIERIYNYKYPYEYIGNFGEILRRKERITEFYTQGG